MFEHQSKCKAMALGLVAMLVFCSVSVMCTDSDTAGNRDETYTIHMRVGNTFTYTPQVNLPSSDGATVGIDVDGTASSPGMGDDYRNGTLTFQPTEAGNETVKFRASWVKGDLIQSVAQTIVFDVRENLQIGGNTSPATSIRTSADVGTVLYTPTVTSGNGPFSYTCDIPSAIQSFIGWDEETKAVKVTSEVPSSAISSVPYDITVNVTDAGITATDDRSNTMDAQAVSIRLSLTVSDDYMITAVSYFETFDGPAGEGESRDLEFDVGTNGAALGATDEVITLSVTDSAGQTMDNGLATYSGGKVIVDPSKAGFTGSETGSDTYRDFTVRITAQCSLGTDTHDVRLRVYAHLSFISAPTIDNISVTPASGNGLDITVSASIGNAMTVRYIWGDGSETVVDPSGAGTYSARHLYAQEGMYYITVRAENSEGVTDDIIMYDAQGNGPVPGDDGQQDDGSREGHGYQFISFAALAVFMAILIVYYGYRTPLAFSILALAVVMTVLLFAYRDFEGVMEALRGLF